MSKNQRLAHSGTKKLNLGPTFISFPKIKAGTKLSSNLQSQMCKNATPLLEESRVRRASKLAREFCLVNSEIIFLFEKNQ